MKIIITGASGLVGHAVVKAALANKFEVIALSHERSISLPEGTRLIQADLSAEGAADRILLEEFPDIIVNAAAASSIRSVQANPELAERLNVALPRRLAELANHLNARLIHFSTDMVFDGSAAPYRSSDMPAPLDLYGQLKLLAEREILKAGGDFVTILRIPIVTGDSPSGQRSVHERLFADWSEGKTVPLHTDEIRQPVSASSVGELCIELCQRRNLHGIFHWAGREELSRYDMGLRILKHFGLPESLVEAVETHSEDRRALDLRMELRPLLGKVRTTPPDYTEQLETMTVPPLSQAWYRSIRGSDGEAKQLKRFVKGRDF